RVSVCQERVIFLRVDVLVNGFDGRELAVLAELDGIHDLFLDLLVDGIERFIGGEIVLQEVAFQADDGIVVLLFVELFLGSIIRGVAHGVSTIPISTHLQNRRLPLARQSQMIGYGLVYAEYVHAVGQGSRHVVAGGIPMKFRLCEGTSRRRTHRVLVILDDANAGRLVQGRQIGRFVEGALSHRTVAEIGQTRTSIFTILVGKGDSHADGDVTTDDAVAAVEIELFLEVVHGAALTAGGTGDLPV